MSVFHRTIGLWCTGVLRHFRMRSVLSTVVDKANGSAKWVATILLLIGAVVAQGQVFETADDPGTAHDERLFLMEGVVRAQHFMEDSITAAKIANNIVSGDNHITAWMSDDLADGAVTTEKIADSTLANFHFADDFMAMLSGTELDGRTIDDGVLDSTVFSFDANILAAGNLGQLGAKLAAGTIPIDVLGASTFMDLGIDRLDNTVMLDVSMAPNIWMDFFTNGHVAEGTIDLSTDVTGIGWEDIIDTTNGLGFTSAALSSSDGAIFTEMFAMDTIDADAIADEAIDADVLGTTLMFDLMSLATDAVTDDAVADDSLDGSMVIANDAITAAQLESMSIMGDRLAAMSVTTDKLNTESFKGRFILSADSVMTVNIADMSIATPDFAENTITGAKLAQAMAANGDSALTWLEQTTNFARAATDTRDMDDANYNPGNRDAPEKNALLAVDFGFESVSGGVEDDAGTPQDETVGSDIAAGSITHSNIAQGGIGYSDLSEEAVGQLLLDLELQNTLGITGVGPTANVDVGGVGLFSGFTARISDTDNLMASDYAGQTGINLARSLVEQCKNNSEIWRTAAGRADTHTAGLCAVGGTAAGFNENFLHAGADGVFLADRSATLGIAHIDPTNPEAVIETRLSDAEAMAFTGALDSAINAFEAGQLIAQTDGYQALVDRTFIDDLDARAAITQYDEWHVALSNILGRTQWTQQELGGEVGPGGSGRAERATADPFAPGATTLTAIRNFSVRAQVNHLADTVGITDLTSASRTGTLHSRVNYVEYEAERLLKAVAVGAALRDADIPPGRRGAASLTFARYGDYNGIALGLASIVGKSSRFTLSVATNSDLEETLNRIGYDVAWK